MSVNEELMQEIYSDDKYEELWIVVMNTKGRYELSKNQARLVQEALARGERGAIVFETFAISIPYIAEFFREKKFLKDQFSLSAQTQEKPYEPIADDKWAEIKKKIYKNIGR